MKVLLVANGYPPRSFGGVEVYTAGLAEALRSRGHAVFVFCAEGLVDQTEYAVLEEHQAGITIFRLANSYRKVASFEALYADQQTEVVFERLLERIQPDLIHFNHLIKLSARLPLLVAARDVPTLYTAHDFWALCQRIYLQDWRKQACPGPICGGQCYPCVTAATPLERARTFTIATLRTIVPFRLRMLLRSFLAQRDYFLPDMHTTPALMDARYALFREALHATDRIVAPSEYVKRMYVANGYAAEKIEVVPLGIPTPEHDAQPSAGLPGIIRLAFVGTILPLKGAEVLLRAFLATPSPNLRLTFYGREDILPAFARKLRHLAAHDARVAFAGPFQPADKDRVYDEIDALVIPSLAHESFSLVAREALLRGKPVIAADTGALPEIIIDGVNGFLTPRGDVAALTNLLTRLAEQPERLAALHLPGPVHILSVDQHVERLLEVYATCRAPRS